MLVVADVDIVVVIVIFFAIDRATVVAVTVATIMRTASTDKTMHKQEQRPRTLRLNLSYF
jgi:hypothetical protein